MDVSIVALVEKLKVHRKIKKIKAFKANLIMLIKSLLRPLIASAVILMSVPAYSQPSGGFGRSPQINPDNTVAFRFRAPNAQDVRLSVQSEKAPVRMEKDARGSWSATIGPVKPDIYPYHFIVDGVQVMDPGNWSDEH